MSVDPHRLAELRSIAFHRAAVAKLASEADVRSKATERMRAWRDEGRVPEDIATAWLQALALPDDALLAFVSADDERGRHLRSFTPFAGALDPRERWALWKHVAREAGGAP